MKSILSNPIVIGGVIPMLIFGLWNFFYKPLSLKLPLAHLVFGIAFGGILTIFIFDLFTDKTLLKTPPKFENLYAIGLGGLWASALMAMAYAFGKLGGNTSQILPIINVNTLVTVFLVLLFLPEPVIAWKIIVGSSLIVLGSWILL